MNGLQQYIAGDFDPIDEELTNWYVFSPRNHISPRITERVQGKEAALKRFTELVAQQLGRPQEHNDFQIFNKGQTNGMVNGLVIEESAAQDDEDFD